MDLGVLEGQTRGDYFLNSIFDPSVKQCTVQFTVYIQGVPKEVHDSKMMLWGAFRYLSSLTMILGTLI